MKSNPKNAHEARLKAISAMSSAAEELMMNAEDLLAASEKALFFTILAADRVLSLFNTSEEPCHALVDPTKDERSLIIFVTAEAEDMARNARMTATKIADGLHRHRLTLREVATCAH